MQNKPPFYEVKQLSRRFGGLVAVSDVSFQVYESEIFGLIGPNGAGKTTLFNLMTGLIPPSSGEVWYRGTQLTYASATTIARQGFARTFQNIRLFAELSVLQNILIGQHQNELSSGLAQVLGLPNTRTERKRLIEQAHELLKLVGLQDRATELAGNLSYGDQRRLEIARALAAKPQILLLDEPAAGMNVHEKQALSAFIRELRSLFDLTIILIEHHVPLVMGLCDRIAVLDFGKLIALGQPESVRDDPAVIEAYLGDE